MYRYGMVRKPGCTNFGRAATLVREAGFSLAYGRGGVKCNSTSPATKPLQRAGYRDGFGTAVPLISRFAASVKFTEGYFIFGQITIGFY